MQIEQRKLQRISVDAATELHMIDLVAIAVRTAGRIGACLGAEPCQAQVRGG